MTKLINFLVDKKKIINKIFFTLFIIFIYVIGTSIYIPFLSKSEYQAISVLRQLGSSFNKSLLSNNNSLCILSLGVIPYVTASIVIQLSQKVFTFMKEWQEQGEKGKRKINIVTRVLTIFLSLGHGWALCQTEKFVLGPSLLFSTLFFLTVGVFISIWLADLITSKGLGNGISILIAVGMVDKLFKTFKYLLSNSNGFETQRILILISYFVLLILTIILSSAYLKIPINYAINRNNDKIDKYIPIKLNTSGILPIILADTLLNVIQQISMLFSKNGKVNEYIGIFVESRSELGIYFFVYILLIMLFSFFSSFMTINPKDVAEHLSKQNAYLKDVQPGLPTVKKIVREMFKITFLGSCFLTLLASTPDIINYLAGSTISQNIPFGGTSLLIIVGVALESIQDMKAKNNVKRTYNKFF
ncbi:preprotein translocase subunit SecY [Candidatus Phytoplasma ziziphi]|uniref:Protein translocase subunit SecY n=5 Tax=Candidatus Phytoplasma TaxID=33926 RepID=A0A660HLQ3_ZIZJU|nr:preprotein translocase subunit SecY [Candidatus Phytoplasma ziziphi]ATY46526.1 translocation protein ['Prunus avium' virescence phytoplasma]ATY46529.1 translocation protein ['Prunus avium' virescence phytoplasma]ATY46535.1 translocation protein ['Prunus avium' virescence phytoplasma]ATY46538.1 translocation protein ['Prunus avium' virescence phytoplasma]ATY46541.1 translocation protein ['Prunus avium' virescence phytoplasma]